MNKDTADFLNVLLEDASDFDGECFEENLEGKTIYDFHPEFVSCLDNFLAAFRKKCHMLGLETEFSRSFGENVYWSLSGNGIGFWDEMDGEEINRDLILFASPNRFEELNSSLWIHPDGISLAFQPEYLSDYVKKLFAF